VADFVPFTLAQLREKVRERADMDGDQFIDDDALDERINSAWAELYDLLVDVHEDFFQEQTTFELSANVDTYSLAAIRPRVKKVRGVDLVLSSATGDVAPIPRFEWSERGRYAGAPDFARRRTGTALRYCFRKNEILFVPVPIGERTIRLTYIPQLTPLSDADPNATPDPLPSVDLPDVVEPGWEEFIVITAAISCLDKEESDTVALERNLERLRRRIEGSAPSRDAENPPRMIRRAPFDGGPGGFGGAGDGGWDY
jgi:hypothetical protein